MHSVVFGLVSVIFLVLATGPLNTTQNSTHTKEYSLNKPMPFSGDQMKVKAFLQECLVYIDMNKEIYTMDKLKIGFVLLYMNEKEAKTGENSISRTLKIQQQESWYT